MSKHRNIAVILTLILAVTAVAISAYRNRGESSTTTSRVAPMQVTAATEDEAEMRGMWVSYISLDMSNTDRTEESFRNRFAEIISSAEEQGCNALFVHVRAFCDAMYKSELFPSSHILWGEQGKEDTYDALEIMCEQCSAANLEIHAWINPYRIATEASDFTLSEDNPYKRDSSLGIEYQGGVYLNPAKSESRKLIVDGVKEILEKYPVDGIHFDDYFYPTSDASFDKADYNKYLKAFKSEADAMPLEEWRKNNVNLLIAQVYQTVKSINKSVDFGISPQGNINNDLEMGADVKSWCEYVGYVDYICPQLYYSLENPALKFRAGLDDWLQLKRHKSLKLYAGLAVYKVGTDADSGTWKESNNILAQQLEIIRSKKLDGYILYDCEAVKSEKAQKEMSAFRECLD